MCVCVCARGRKWALTCVKERNEGGGYVKIDEVEMQGKGIRRGPRSHVFFSCLCRGYQEGQAVLDGEEEGCSVSRPTGSADNPGTHVHTYMIVISATPLAIRHYNYDIL